MVDYPYTTVPGKLGAFLTKIRNVGVPPKVTAKWLKGIGFTSSNDATIIPVLRFIQLIDTSNVPTTLWARFRGAEYKKVLGEGIKAGYEDLFAIYPDANSRSPSEIENVFKTSTTAGAQAVSKTISTFRALVEQAEFTTTTNEVVAPAGALHVPPSSEPPTKQTLVSRNAAASLHIDIQIHISPDSTSEQIDQIFASMAKHLYKDS